MKVAWAVVAACALWGCAPEYPWRDTTGTRPSTQMWADVAVCRDTSFRVDLLDPPETEERAERAKFHRCMADKGWKPSAP